MLIYVSQGVEERTEEKQEKKTYTKDFQSIWHIKGVHLFVELIHEYKNEWIYTYMHIYIMKNLMCKIRYVLLQHTS